MDENILLRPREVLQDYKIDKISCDPNIVVFLDANAVLRAWGNNYYGTLGDGTTIDRMYDNPVKIFK